MTELILIRRAQRGNRDALEKLVRLYYRKIYQYISFHVESKETAEDLTQETFLKMVKNLPSFVPLTSFSAWLHRIAHNTMVDYLRTVRETGQLDEDALEAGEGAYARTEADAALQTLLDGLPEIQRDCILLRYINGLKYQEIADALNLPVSTVKSHVRRGLTAMKKRSEES